MDPARGLIHLGLKVTETMLDRALDVVRLADTLLVATAAPDVRERAGSRAWPDEEEADLDAIGETLIAKETAGSAPARPDASRGQKTTGQKKAPAKKSTGQKKAPAKKSTGQKKAPAKKSTGQKKAPAKKSTGQKKAPAKKTTSTPAPPVAEPLDLRLPGE